MSNANMLIDELMRQNGLPHELAGTDAHDKG
jgi:hypothetical protein